MKDRVYDVLGGYGSGARLARGIGLSLEQTNRILNGKYEVPQYVEATVELLEVVKMHAPDKLPARWKQ